MKPITFDELVENILHDTKILKVTNRYLFLDTSLDKITEILVNNDYKKDEQRSSEGKNDYFYHEDDNNCRVDIGYTRKDEKEEVKEASGFDLDSKIKLNLLYYPLSGNVKLPEPNYLKKIKPIFEGIITEKIPALFSINYPMIGELEPYAINTPN